MIDPAILAKAFEEVMGAPKPVKNNLHWITKLSITERKIIEDTIRDYYGRWNDKEDDR